MNMHTRTIDRNDHVASPSNGSNGATPGVKRENWTQKYAVRILKLWLKWETPLGIAQSYAAKIRNDLASFYDDPLKRMFIEATY